MRKKKSRLSIQKFTALFLMIVLLFSILKISKTFASTDNFSLTNVVITEKSDSVVVNSLSFERMSIINDIVFHKVGDSVKYKITVVNNESENYKVKSIKDDSTNEYIDYEYGDYTETKLNSKETATFEIVAKYVKKIDNLANRIQKVKVSFIFELEDSQGNTKEEKLTVNPDEEENTSTTKTSNTDIKTNENKEIPSLKSSGLTTDSNDIDAESQVVEEKENIDGNQETSVQKVSTEVVAKHNNPKTGDEIGIYIVTAIVSFIMLTTMSRKNKVSNSKIKRYMNKKNKGFKTFSFFFALTLMLPVMSKASNNSFIATAENQFGLCDKVIVTTIIDGGRTEKIVDYGEAPDIDDPTKEGFDFNGWELEDGTEYDINKPVKDDITIIAKFEEHSNEPRIGRMPVFSVRNATFDVGSKVNIKMKNLAGDNVTAANIEDVKVTAIKKSDIEPEDENKTSKNIVSSADSQYPIYMWYENGTIYWWSKDNTPALNEDSSSMFRHFTNLTDISGLADFDASKAKNFGTLFANNLNITSYLPIQNWDVSNVTAINSMFQRNNKLKDVEGLRNWNVSSVKNMYNTFANCWELSNIDALSTWDTSSLEILDQAFFYCKKITDLTPISDWNTSNVRTTKNLFSNCEGLTSIAPLAKWDTNKFEDIYAMFCCCRNVEKYITLWTKEYKSWG